MPYHGHAVSSEPSLPATIRDSRNPIIVTCDTQDLSCSEGDECGTLTVKMPDNTIRELALKVVTVSYEIGMATEVFEYDGMFYAIRCNGLQAAGYTLNIYAENEGGQLGMILQSINITDAQ